MNFNKALEKMCDHYCKKPVEIQNQEELDEVCDNCPMVQFLKENYEQLGGVANG